jgi:N-acetylmuramoyl-L-alanine amidase
MQVALCVTFVLSGTTSILAAENVGFDAVHQRYLSLRNTDLEFKRVPEWNKVAEDFISASWQEHDPLKAQRSLYEAAILFKTLAKNQQASWNQLRSVALLEELVGRFSEGTLADDALLAQSEILYSLGQHAQARELLKEIVEVYPSSDMVFVARQRLNRASAASEGAKPSRALPNNLPVIVLDPGHGGEDFGALGVGGLLEKDVALSISLRVKKLIEESERFRVVLTRATDKFSPLAERMHLANRLNAALFLSIHANASVHKKLSGVETYYLDNAADKASATLAERENKVGAPLGDLGEDLSFMISDLIQNAKLPESIALAKSVQRGVVRIVRPKHPELNDLGVKAGPFYVLVGAHMPCALVEVSFIDHPIEGSSLGSDQYRELLAQGIAEGILGIDRASSRR